MQAHITAIIITTKDEYLEMKALLAASCCKTNSESVLLFL